MEVVANKVVVGVPPRSIVGTSLSSYVLAGDLWTSRELGKRWSASSTCATAKSFSPRMEHKRSVALLVLSKLYLAINVRV